MSKRRGNNEGSVFWDKSKERWCAEITLPDGKRKRKRHQSRKVVQEWLLEQRSQIKKGIVVKDTNEAVRDYMARFLEEVVAHTVKPATYTSYSFWIKTHIVPSIGHLKLKNLQPHHLQHLYSQKLDEGLSKRSVQYMHAIIRRALNQAVKQGILIRNPTNAVTAPKPQKKTFATLTVDQVRQFLKEVEGHRWYPIYVIAVMMGLRKGEILGLRWQDINFDNNTISVENVVLEINGKIHLGSPKTKKSKRTVAMPEYVANVLKKYRKDVGAINGLIFQTSSGKPVSPRNLSRHYYQARESANIPKVRFHDLRHTAATLLLKENVHPKIVQEMLGHSSITLTLDTYSHVIPGIQKKAADKMDYLFNG
ncbi:MAG: site-specific integrase [Anaerolineaceae bacterium]|nr:site-specific integrase [Anaerolineaceae bacterium]